MTSEKIARPIAPLAAALAAFWGAGCLGPMARGIGAPPASSAVLNAPSDPTPSVAKRSEASESLHDAGEKSVSPEASPSAAVAGPPPPRPHFLFPLAGAKVRSAYGKRRGKLHTGIDLQASPRGGEPVLASAGGVVVQTGQHGGYGRMVLLKHPDGWYTRYAHMRSVLVQKNDTVAAGDTLGLVGRTGRATGPHLHFEILTPAKKTVNPAAYLFPPVSSPSRAALPPLEAGSPPISPAVLSPRVNH